MDAKDNQQPGAAVGKALTQVLKSAHGSQRPDRPSPSPPGTGRSTPLPPVNEDDDVHPSTFTEANALFDPGPSQTLQPVWPDEDSQGLNSVGSEVIGPDIEKSSSKTSSLRDPSAPKRGKNVSLELASLRTHSSSEEEGSDADAKDKEAFNSSQDTIWDADDAVRVYGTRARDLDDDDDEGDGQTKYCLIYPDSRWRSYWDIVVFVLLLYTIFVLPWRLAFFSGWDWLDVLVDSLFFVDIVFTFFQAIERNSGKIVTNRKTIAKEYLRGWFLLDSIATFPFYLIAGTNQSRASTLLRIPRLFKIFRLLRLLKLLRALKFQEFFKQLEDSSDIHPGYFRLLRLLFWVVATSHICACIWVFITLLSSDDFGGWILFNGFENHEDGALYVIAFYWTWTTLTGTGYGDITPTNQGERVYAAFVMAIGVALLAYATATIASVLQSLDTQSTNFRQHMESLVTFMKVNNLPSDLRTKIRKYMRYTWADSKTSFDSITILKRLPLKLRAEVAGHLHEDVVENCVLLRDAPRSFVTETLMTLHPSKHPAEEITCTAGQTVTDWYIIRDGEVEAQDHFGNPFLILGPGSTFGEVGLLITGTWFCNMVCTKPTTLLNVPKTELRPILARYPGMREKFKEIARQRLHILIEEKRRYAMLDDPAIRLHGDMREHHEPEFIPHEPDASDQDASEQYRKTTARVGRPVSPLGGSSRHGSVIHSMQRRKQTFDISPHHSPIHAGASVELSADKAAHLPDHMKKQSSTFIFSATPNSGGQDTDNRIMRLSHKIDRTLEKQDEIIRYLHRHLF